MARGMSDAAVELKLYTDNDSQLYHQQGLPIIKNLVAKMARGTYDSTKAVKLFGYLCESGAKKYVREFGGGAWHQVFTVADRKQAATAMRDDFEEEASTGAYEEYVPKKYRKSGSRRNPPDSVKFSDRDIGAALHNWHSSSGDPIYATGSLIWAGRPVPIDLLEETISALKVLKRSRYARGADKRELHALIKVLSA